MSIDGMFRQVDELCRQGVSPSDAWGLVYANLPQVMCNGRLVRDGRAAPKPSPCKQGPRAADSRRQQVRDAIAARMLRDFRAHMDAHPTDDPALVMRRCFKNAVALDHENYDNA